MRSSWRVEKSNFTSVIQRLDAVDFKNLKIKEAVRKENTEYLRIRSYRKPKMVALSGFV